ncbi:MAG: peptidoglycan-binding protein [Anaerovoracaceae bacterium]|nr:peptidoglycan-binding protein [Anaerovoracaceae bacterium]
MISVLYRQYFLKYNYGYYTGALDGISGSGTKAAIKKFQRGYGLSQDGIWGTKTNAKAVAVTKELQTLLNKYGAGVSVDGVLGQKTAAAIKTVQKKLGLTVDGCAGQATWAKLRSDSGSSGSTSTASGGSSAHFAKSEFKCSCGGRYCNGYPAGNTSAKLLNILEGLRAYYGKPITITSGQRCKTRNRQVGGATNSAHTKGKAADIYIPGICNTAAGRRQVVSKAYSLGAAYAYANTAGMGNAVHINV